SNDQGPMTNDQGPKKSQFQNPKLRPLVGIWILDILWALVIGPWSFAFLPPAHGLILPASSNGKLAIATSIAFFKSTCTDFISFSNGASAFRFKSFGSVVVTTGSTVGVATVCSEWFGVWANRFPATVS